MDIKLILENQLAIMQWIIEYAHFVSGNLPEQIEKTKARVDNWDVPSPPIGN
jgi:hypothetical protein